MESVKESIKVIIYLLERGLAVVPDKLYLQIKYLLHTGKILHLKNPKSFNEKVQWMKLYDRNPEYVSLVDKYEVRKYVSEKIGEKYLVPLLGVWDKTEDVDFGVLPEQFVLKCTHDSGGVVICRNKKDFEKERAIRFLNRRYWRNYYYSCREWPYKMVKPRIIAEQYLYEKNKIVPEDYKVYCFNGKPKYIVVFHNRFDKSKRLSETVYDVNWVPQHISLDNHFDISDEVMPKPECLDELLTAAETLCAGFPQVRTDFYIVENKIYFGELTLYTASGFQPMIPRDLDQVLGEMVELSLLKN